jgi:hypothetical protein
VVVNFANVGITYGKRILKRDKTRGQTLMDYEGVRRCLQHLTEKSCLKVIGVVYEDFKAVNASGQPCWSPPEDITAMCESIKQTPRATGSQRTTILKCAYDRNCRFLDNDDYMDWLDEMSSEDIRRWFESNQEFLQMGFYFDMGLGTFDTIDGKKSRATPAMQVSPQ